MHRSYHPNLGGKAIPSNQLINKLGKDNFNYIGTFSEYNPIGLVDRLAVYVRKNTCTMNYQTNFTLRGFKLKSGLNYHGEDFSNNSAIKFSKQDLLRIANEMDTEDELHIAFANYIDKDKYQKNILLVTK